MHALSRCGALTRAYSVAMVLSTGLSCDEYSDGLLFMCILLICILGEGRGEEGDGRAKS